MNIFCLRCCFSLFYSGQMFGCVILQNSSLPFWSVSDLSVLKAASIALHSIINWTGMNSSSIMHCTGALVTNQWIPNFKNHQLLVQQKPKRVLGREMRACSCPAVWRLSLRIIKCSASDRTFPKVLVYVLVVTTLSRWPLFYWVMASTWPSSGPNNIHIITHRQLYTFTITHLVQQVEFNHPLREYS